MSKDKLVREKAALQLNILPVDRDMGSQTILLSQLGTKRSI